LENEMRGLMRAVQVQWSSGIKNAQKKTTHHPTENDPNPATQPSDPDDQGSKIFQGGLDRLEYWSPRKPSINRNACSSARDARRYSLTYITHTHLPAIRTQVLMTSTCMDGQGLNQDAGDEPSECQGPKKITLRTLAEVLPHRRGPTFPRQRARQVGEEIH
jgi:hypothetical protein